MGGIILGQVKFIGCLHFNHKSMAKYRGFQDDFYHDEYMVQQWNSVVHKRDLVIIVGDVTMEKSDSYYQLDRLNGRKKVVLGNHDMGRHNKEMLKYVDSLHGSYDYKGYMITHIPIHPNEVHFYRANIHAHIHHENKLEEVIVNNSYLDKDSEPKPTLNKYWNVDALLLDFKPRTLEELSLIYKNK